MIKPYKIIEKKHQIIKTVLLAATLVVMCLILSGCGKETLSSVLEYLNKDAVEEEETAPVNIEDRMFTAQLEDAAGQPVTKANGEPVTVLAAYETAAGGEPRINEEGIPETYPLGEFMTYPAGEPVTDAEGNYETYAGGETVTGVLGNALRDTEGNPVTREAGEIVTYGDSDIVYDEAGNKKRYSGEPLTYAPGEYMYDTNGEKVFSGFVYLKDENGQPVTQEDGNPRISPIEVVTDASGDILLEDDGEVATKVLEPLAPDRVIEQPVEEGSYYIRSLESPYVWLSATEVYAENVHVPDGAEPETKAASEPDPAKKESEEETTEPLTEAPVEPEEEDPEKEDPEEEGSQEEEGHLINNIQLEILGADLPYFELRFDAEGYGYFVLQGTEQVLGIEGSVRNGANVLLQEMEKITYPQYEYWDEPVFTLENHQKWILTEEEDGSFVISSAANQEYRLTVDDATGVHYGNIMVWKPDEKRQQQQHFLLSVEEPRITPVLEEGTYYIRTGLNNWMMVSVGDYNFDDAREIYLYHSDGMDGQMFTVSYDEYGFATIAHSDSTKVLSVRESTAANNQGVIQFESDGDPWQKWILEEVPGEGSFIIRSALNVSEVLNLASGVVAEVQPINLYWNDNTYAQRWFFLTEPPEAIVNYESMLRYAQGFSSATEYLILVNTITNQVGIYSGWHNNWECEYFWPCVTGKPSTPTVKGTFYIEGRQPYFDGDTDSPEWYTCYYATMFYPQYFFHSIVYYKGTEDIMDDSMGINASHGCVRLYIDDAQWIYENIPDGTTVYIF